MDETAEIVAPGVDDIQVLVAFLTALYDEEGEPLHVWDRSRKDPEESGNKSKPQYSEAVLAFFDAASSECWRDTGYDPTTARELLRDKTFLRNASAEQLKTLVTFFVRGERFCDGFWAGMIEHGHVHNVLMRLQAIHESHRAE